MREINLYRIWQIVNILQDRVDELLEQGIFVYLLGGPANYVRSKFENFLNHYSFKIKDDYILVFKDDGVFYEDYANSDSLYVSKELLIMSDEEVLFWAEKETEKVLEQQKKVDQNSKKRLRLEIKRLTKQYESL